MPNTRSAKKRMRQNLKRRERNRRVKTEVKSIIKKVRKLVAEGKIEEARALLPRAQSIISRAWSKGVLHKNTVSRKISRLHHLVARAESQLKQAGA